MPLNLLKLARAPLSGDATRQLFDAHDRPTVTAIEPVAYVFSTDPQGDLNREP
jgi:hypothetical protein